MTKENKMTKSTTKEVIKLNHALLLKLISVTQYYEYIGNLARAARTKNEFNELNALIANLKGSN